MFVQKSYHYRVEDDENGWPQHSSGAQEVGGVRQTQYPHQGPSCQQAAHWHRFIQPLAITGADVDQLGVEKFVQQTELKSFVSWVISNKAN